MTWSEYMLETCGYVTKTTFYDDFTIADHFGIKAIKDTYNRAFNEWKNNVEYITEFVMVLNHKMWHHHQSNPEIAKVYYELYEKANDWCMDNLKGEDLDYFYKTTD
jgi:hypothetical protein